MKLSTGKVAFPIEFDNGDKAVIYLNPNDDKTRERIENFAKSATGRMEMIDTARYNSDFDDKIPDVDLNDLDSVLDLSKQDIENIQRRCDAIRDLERECNEVVKAELDEVFDEKISDKIFKYCQPFDMVIYTDDKGKEKREMYIMQFMRWLASALNKYGYENNKAINKYISKYSNDNH